MDNLGKIGRSLMDNWGGGGIRQLINILFCGYRSDIHDPLSEKNASRNLYSSGAQVPQRVIS
jgi:hypothetical protein